MIIHPFSYIQIPVIYTVFFQTFKNNSVRDIIFTHNIITVNVL